MYHQPAMSQKMGDGDDIFMSTGTAGAIDPPQTSDLTTLLAETSNTNIG